MSSERVLELVSAAADGALTDEERALLDRLLEESPEARRFQDDLGRIDSIMHRLPELVPPEALHDRVMAGTSLPLARQRRPIFAWLDSLSPFTALRYGMATAAGLVLAAVFYESQSGFGETADIRQLVGTMAPNRDRSAAEILDRHAFRMEGLDSQILLERRDGALLLDIQVDAGEPIDISVDLAAAGARLDALAQTGSSLESIEISGRTLRVRALGRRQLTALLQRVDDAPVAGTEKIELEFSRNGKVLRRGSLTPAW
jgi:hypothetical protein